MDSPALEIIDVAKSYARRSVLRGLSARIDGGSFVGLAGLNGAGKTTLIRCILDLTAISAGTLRIAGIDHRDPAARNHLAYLPERFSPPSFLRGLEFLQHAARLYGEDLHDDVVQTLCADLGLDPAVLERPVRELSKGTAQKLGLAAAVLSAKPILLLDEPMSGLDPQARQQLKQVLRRLKQQGRSVFLTTHLLADVQQLCDRLLVLHEGRFVFDGSPAAFCATYGMDDLDQAFIRCIGKR
jgi:ABC-2 type transport system ATP-binding protein